MNRKERKPTVVRDARTMESSAAEQALKKKTQRRIFRWSSALLGSLLAVVMFYALMKPAITLVNGEDDVENRRAMIIEVKKSDSRANKEKSCDKALKQITDNEYAKHLDNGFEKVLCYGIAFYQKSAMIKKI